jgi:hypothetical protein
MLNKLHKIATSAEWLMRPVEHASMMKIIERMEDAPKREGVDICGDATEFESMQDPGRDSNYSDSRRHGPRIENG